MEWIVLIKSNEKSYFYSYVGGSIYVSTHQTIKLIREKRNFRPFFFFSLSHSISSVSLFLSCSCHDIVRITIHLDTSAITLFSSLIYLIFSLIRSFLLLSYCQSSAFSAGDDLCSRE